MVPIVLVVDDDVASTVVLAKLLERLGCEVLVRADAESAVELALCGRVDVVSLDISMPHLDGYQMLALVRSHEHSRRLPSVPLIAVTGRVAPADKAHALAHGFAAHLGKPVLLVELRQALTRALTLRSELQRTRYSVDQADLVANLGELDHAGRGDELRTVAGLALALEQGSRIHPQYRAEFESGFSVAWHRVTWNRGSWSNTNPAARRKLAEPQGRVYLAGDHLNMNAWMQGAFESARQTATAVHARAVAEQATARV